MLLLAAGLGTRLRPITDSMPKALVPIAGRPILDYWLELLSDSGVLPRNILVNLHYRHGAVRAFLNASPAWAQVNSVYEPELQGTAGTMLANRAFFTGETVLLAHADNLTLFPMVEFLARHSERPHKSAITMMTFRTDDPQSCGIVELDDAGIVTAFHEKKANPPGNMANGAVYLLEREVIDSLAELPGPIRDFSLDVIPRYLGRVQTFENSIYHRDIGNPSSLALAEADFPECYERFRRMVSVGEL